MTDFSHLLIASRRKGSDKIEYRDQLCGGMDDSVYCEDGHAGHWYARRIGCCAEDIAKWYAACKSAQSGITHYPLKMGYRRYKMVDALAANPPADLLEDGQEDALEAWKGRVAQAMLDGNWRDEEAV